MKRLSVLAALTLAGLGTAAMADDASLVAKGKYLATAGDCAACHTAEGGKDMAGGLAIATPLGKIIASNITPSKTAGIGTWSETDFARALRQGVAKGGQNLYPAMPYTAYSGLTDDDVKALYAYFMSIPAVDTAAPKTALPFPFNIRMSMKAWNLLFLNHKTFTPDSSQSTEWNRGAYLAQTLAHCSTCHTPRNALMAEKTGEALSGGSLGTWYAPNITPAALGDWSKEQIEAYLKTGRSGTGSQAGGPMLEAIDKSLSKLSDDDISALATWLKSVPSHEGMTTDGTVASKGLDNEIALMAGTAPEGAQLYSQSCATCHGISGTGGNGLPALLGNAAAKRPVADNMVMAILDGVHPTTGGQVMPAFGDKLNDEQVATLTNYITANLGNEGVKTTTARVTELRNGGAPSKLLALARAGMMLGVVVVVLLILALILWRIRRRA